MAARQQERREINPRETLGVTRALREEKKERERKLEEESDSKVRPVPPAMDTVSCSTRENWKLEMDKRKKCNEGRKEGEKKKRDKYLES